MQKILNSENKYFTLGDYNKFTSQTLDAKIKKQLVNKSAIAGFMCNDELNKSSDISSKSTIKSRVR